MKITTKTTVFLIKNELEVGKPPWKPIKGIIPTIPFVNDCSTLENQKQHNNCHHQI